MGEKDITRQMLRVAMRETEEGSARATAILAWCRDNKDYLDLPDLSEGGRGKKAKKRRKGKAAPKPWARLREALAAPAPDIEDAPAPDLETVDRPGCAPGAGAGGRAAARCRRRYQPVASPVVAGRPAAVRGNRQQASRGRARRTRGSGHRALEPDPAAGSCRAQLVARRGCDAGLERRDVAGPAPRARRRVGVDRVPRRPTSPSPAEFRRLRRAEP